MCSVQSSLLFLYYVEFGVKSVQYCLCVSWIQCTQCSMSVHSVGSVQCKQCSCSHHQISFLSVQSILRVESVAHIVNGVQWQLGYSLWRSWSAYYYSVSAVFCLSSIHLSVGFSLQRSVSIQSLQRSGWVLFSGSFSVCTLRCLHCSQYWLFTKSLSVMFMSCSESTL